MQRKTPNLKLVILLLRASNKPLTLKELWDLVKVEQPKAAFSTIFRIIQRLESLGKVSRVELRERSARYEWAKEHHHHLFCVGCESVKKITEKTINIDLAAIEKQTGYKIDNHVIEFEGLCTDCQSKK